MASPAWLQQEVQSSTSQSPASAGGTATPTAVASPPTAGIPTSTGPSGTPSDSVPESAQTKFVNATGYVVQAPSFSYSVLPNASSSGSSHQSSSSSVVNSNPPASTVVRQPLVPGLSSSSGPTFSYNISHTSAGLHGSQQFQSKTLFSPGDGVARQPIVPGNSQREKNASPPAASLQPPVPGQSARPNSFVPGTALSIVPPPVLSPISIPKGVSSNSASFSFTGNPLLMQKDQSSKSNTSDAAAQDAGIASSASSMPPSFVLPAHTSSTTSASSTPNLVPATLWVPMVPSFSVPSGMSGTPGTPGPPGIGQSAPSSSNLTVPSAVMDSSSSAVLRPIIPATPIPNPAVQQQIYPTYPSLPAIAASPQGLWLQPPQVGGSPRPPFLPYPAVFPGPFPLPARGMPLPSVPLPDSQPPGVTPVGTSGATPTSSVTFGDQLASSSGIPPELPLPRVDNKHVNDVGIKDGAAAVNEQLDAWTAHKTDTGVIYYYNALTGESTYEKPSGFMGESDKVIVQPTPVSWDKLAGTDWALVSTNDNKKYYYNMKTKLSSWQIPTEVTELKKKQDDDTVKEHSMPLPSPNVLTEKGSAPNSLSAPAVNTGGRDATALRSLYVVGSSSALDLIKKKLQDSGAPVTSSPVLALSGSGASEVTGLRAGEATVRGQQSENSKDKLKDSNGDGNMSDSSSDSEDADSGPTKEQCIIQFKVPRTSPHAKLRKEMLKERGVAPFSKWEKELPKIVFDPRFKAIPSHSARRSLFEHYVKTRAEEKRKEKRAAQKAAIEGFKQLLEEASEDIDHNTDYQTLKKKWGNDPRFEALDRKDRELLLNERVLPLKRAADEKAQAIRAAVASSFKSMLRDKGDITKSTRWSRVKDSLRNDPRYKCVKHEDRELLFNEYVSELKAAEEEAVRETKAKREEQAAEEEAVQETKAKREEQEKLKERERELRKRKRREEQEMEWVRLKVRRKEAVTSYQALLVETIKDPQASWTESKPKLEKDPQGRATNPDLDPADTEKLFREHVKMLQERCAHEFRTLLAEVITAEAAAQEMEDGKTVFNSWSTAKRLLKVDPRYTKMPRKERESLWRRYIDEMQRKQKSTGDLKEGKHTEGKSRTSVDSGRFPSESRRTHERR